MRRRAYSEGWIRDRYVPSPKTFGYSAATVAIARLFSDRREEWIRNLQETPGLVVFWAGDQFALVIIFHRDGKEAKERRQLIASAPGTNSALILDPQPAIAGFPVYFDFEGSWTNLIQGRGMRAYPRGIPTAPDGSGRESKERWGPRARWAANELLQRPFSGEAENRPSHLVGPFGIPSSERRLLEQGWIAHRVFVDPSRLPPYRGRQPGEVVLATGTFREGVRPSDLFGMLTRDCRVFPFLVVLDGARIVLGMFGQSARVSPAQSPAPRRPVLPTLQAALEGIELFRDVADRIQVPIDHRYDRLQPPAPAAGKSDAGRRLQN